jgi:hypothetical protein
MEHLLAGADPSPQRSMRKLLRCKRTKAFFTKDAGWTRDIQHALTVTEHTVPEAIRDQFKWDELEIYYSFEQSRESQWDFTMSMRVPPALEHLPCSSPDSMVPVEDRKMLPQRASKPAPCFIPQSSALAEDLKTLRQRASTLAEQGRAVRAQLIATTTAAREIRLYLRSGRILWTGQKTAVENSTSAHNLVKFLWANTALFLDGKLKP